MSKYEGVRQTKEGGLLYQTWRRVMRNPHCAEFNEFFSFYSWAVRNGYSPGAWLRRNDKSLPYGPDNCSWLTPEREETPFEKDKFIREWNTAANAIRKYCGMEPLKGTTYDEATE